MHSKFTDAIKFHKNGNLLKANNILLEILDESPRDFDTLHLLGIIAFQTNKYETSINFIKRAIEIDPNNFEIHKNLSVIFKTIGKLDNALQCCNDAIKIKPDYAEAYNHKGDILIRANNYILAIENWKKALKINPHYAEVHNNLGNVYTKLNKLTDALNYYNKSIELKPNFAEAYVNRAFVSKELKNYDSALDDCNKAIKLKHNFAEAFNNKAIIYREIKKMKKAYENYLEAYRLKPNINFLLGSLIYTKLNLGIWDNFEDNLKKLEEKVINKNTSIHPFSSLLFYNSSKIQKIAAERYLNLNYPESLENKKFNIKTYDGIKKIRIGYYSRDFCLHPVSSLIVHFLELHNKEKFEIYGFYFGPDKKDDAMLNRIIKSFDHFHIVRSKTDKDIASLSRNLEIDIAIDLMTYTEKNRFGMFIERCAPIQVNYLGYPGTSGSKHIDYIIADQTLIPKENEKDYSEKIIFLPNSYQSNDSTKKISTKIYTKNEFSLPEKNFIFCCFNKNHKINPNVFDLWIKIMKKVDNSVLWLLEENPIFAENIKKECKKRNFDYKRIIFAKKINLSEHLARHKLADLFLDTMPYGAHTTCSDALWSGLPVITIIGKTFSSRVSASLLNAIKLQELITKNENEYENLAIELATNAEKLNKIKIKLKKNIHIEPLFNTKLFTKNIELAYEKIYTRYINNLPSDNIII